MADSTDRRAAERIPVSPTTNCSLSAPVAEDYGAGRIRDVSMDGIGIILTHKVEIGTLLVVNIANPARGFAKTVFVRVAHVTTVHGGFLVGGSFTTQLTYQEFTSLVT